jgi:cell division protein FtsB
MSDMNFYRSKAARRRIRSIARKASGNKRRTGLLLLAVILTVYLLFDNKGIIARVSLESEKSDMLTKIYDARKITDSLKAHVKALEGDQKTIETIAREKYGMTRRGERMYRVQSERPTK